MPSTLGQVQMLTCDTDEHVAIQFTFQFENGLASLRSMTGDFESDRYIASPSLSSLSWSVVTISFA